jgi:large subunit ribosomal protein L9
VKVIFIEDVPDIARVGQTRNVADGYARNYLFPRKLAVLANSQAAAAKEAQLKKRVKQREMEEAEMAELAKKIEGIEITLEAKVGENEKLYGSITGADIAEALSKAAGHDIEKKKIDLPEPIKQAGSSDVTVKLAHEIAAVIKVNVVSDEAVAEPLVAVEKADAKKEKAGKEEKAEPAAIEAEKPTKKKKTQTAKANEDKPEEEVKPVVVKKAKKTTAKAKKAEKEEEKKES